MTKDDSNMGYEARASVSAARHARMTTGQERRDTGGSDRQDTRAVTSISIVAGHEDVSHPDRGVGARAVNRRRT